MAIELRPFQFSNFARSTLAANLSADDTSLTIQEDDVDLFPVLDTTYDEIFAIVLVSDDGEQTEIAYVTDVDGAVFTIERAQEGTTPLALSAGAVVVHTLTAGFPQQQLGAGPGAVALSGVADGDTTIDLSWTEAFVGAGGAPVASYRIYRRTNAGAYSLLDTVLVANPRTYSDTTLDLANTYDFYVVAVSELGTEGTISNVVGISKSAVVASTDSGTTLGDLQRIIYSADGINWTFASVPNTALPLGGGAYSPTLDRAVVALQNDIWYSDDGGLTWTSNGGPSGIHWSDVAWSPTLGLFLMVGFGSTNAAAWSTDGTTWTQFNMPNNANWNSVLWDAGRAMFICGARGGVTPRSCYSTTGKAMIAGALNSETDDMDVSTTQAGAAPPGDFFMRYTADPTAAWSVSGNNANVGGISGCAYSPTEDVWVAVGSTVISATAAAGGADGVFTIRYTDASIRHTRAFWSPSLELFIVGSTAPASTGTTYRIVTSPDGVTWTEREVPVKAANNRWEHFFEISSVVVTGSA